MNIPQNIADHISTSLTNGDFEIDDKQQAIMVRLGGMHVEALALKDDELINVHYKANKNLVRNLYNAYKDVQKGTPIHSRVVGGTPSDITPHANKKRRIHGELPDNIRPSKQNTTLSAGFDTFRQEAQKTTKLRAEIQTLTLEMQAKGISCSGMDEDKNSKTPSDVVQDLEAIKARAKTALHTASQASKMKSPIDEQTKTKTDLKENNNTVIQLMDDVATVEARIVKGGDTYQYQISNPNPRNTTIETRIAYWRKRHNAAESELSRLAGHKLTHNNPDFTDLSDKDRPLNIAANLSELYDGKWTDGMESIKLHDPNMSEEQSLTILFKSLLIAHEVCKNNKASTSDAKVEMILKKIKDTFNSVNTLDNAILSYVKQSTDICTAMLKQVPSLVFGEIPQRGNDFAKADYKEYSAKGTKVDYVVWPALYLHKDGPILLKGFVKPINTKKTKKTNTVIDDTTKTKADFNESNKTVLQNIASTEQVEARIAAMGDEYKYSRPNPGNAELEVRIKYWKAREDAARNELSRLVVVMARKANPEITDLNDPNRPIKLGERFTDIYDNQWTDASVNIASHNPNMKDEDIVSLLFRSINITHEVCKNNKASTSDAKVEMVLKKIKDTYNTVNNIDSDIQPYIKILTSLCTNMLKTEPNLVFGTTPQRGDSFTLKDYRVYTSNGTKVDYMTFPTLYLYEGGPILFKGIVQPISTE